MIVGGPGKPPDKLEEIEVIIQSKSTNRSIKYTLLCLPDKEYDIFDMMCLIMNKALNTDPYDDACNPPPVKDLWGKDIAMVVSSEIGSAI